MEEQLKALLNSLDEAVLSLSKDGAVLFLNTAAARLFRVSARPGLPTGPIEDFVQRLNLSQVPTDSAGRLSRRIEFRDGSGAALSLEVQLTLLIMEGRPLYLVVIPDPVLQGTLYQARRSQSLGALAGGIAQDFNNVLAAILSPLELALSSRELSAELREHLTTIRTSALRGAELVQRLQSFDGQSTPKPVSVDLPRLIEQVVFVLRRSIDARIRIHCQPPPAPPWPARADPVGLMDVLLNAVLNARDVMTAGEMIITVENTKFTAPLVAPRKPGEFLRISVRARSQDKTPANKRHAGPWLPAGEWDKTSSLGLSLIERVMSEQNGWMELEQDATGERAVHLFLPRGREEQAVDPSPTTPQRASPKVGGQERILLVDDEEMVRMVIRAILIHRGYQVVEAADGEEAVAKFQQSPGFDLVLIDLNMPRLNGRDALLRIRQSDPGVRAIVLSGGVEERDGDMARQLKGVQFLPKPFDNQELLGLVRSSLDAGKLV